VVEGVCGLAFFGSFRLLVLCFRGFPLSFRAQAGNLFYFLLPGLMWYLASFEMARDEFALMSLRFLPSLRSVRNDKLRFAQHGRSPLCLIVKIVSTSAHTGTETGVLC
jgi:hypothetical protein